MPNDKITKEAAPPPAPPPPSPMVHLAPGMRVLVTLGEEQIEGVVYSDPDFATIERRAKDTSFHPWSPTDVYGRGLRVRVTPSMCTAAPPLGVQCPFCAHKF